MAGNRNKLGIKLNTSMLTDALYSFFENELNEFAEVMIAEMKGRTNSRTIARFFVKDWLVREKGQEMKIAVGNSHWFAFLDNYGSGSLMAENNPHRETYLGGTAVTGEQIDINPLRGPATRWAILGRPKGTYRTPDWKKGHGIVPRESTGEAEGVNFEKSKRAVKPRVPKRFLEKTFEAKKREFFDRMNHQLQQFPFANYLDGGGV